MPHYVFGKKPQKPGVRIKHIGINLDPPVYAICVRFNKKFYQVIPSAIWSDDPGCFQWLAKVCSGDQVRLENKQKVVFIDCVCLICQFQKTKMVPIRTRGWAFLHFQQGRLPASKPHAMSKEA